MATGRRLVAPKTGRGQADRLVLFGKGGSGKTTLAKAFLRSVRNAIIVDTKLEGELDDCGIVIEGEDIYDVIASGRAGRFVWHTTEKFLIDFNEQDRFFRKVLRRKNTVVYVDELADVSPSANQYSIGLKLVAQRGRAAGVGLWGSTQRPTAVAPFTISEPRYVVTFEIALRDDQKRIEQIFQQPLDWGALTGTHRFFAKRGRTVEGPLQLQAQLGENAA